MESVVNGVAKRPEVSAFCWTAVVLTCRHEDSAEAFRRELDLRQRAGRLSASTMLLTVPDREEPLGSGGATLNALLVVAEHLSSRAGYTVVTADVLDDARILVLHTGRDFPWSPCSRAFSWLSLEEASFSAQAPVCCVDALLSRLTQQLCPGSPPGVWVCSTDMTFTLPEDFALSWEKFWGVVAVALPGEVSYALRHGVYLSDPQGGVRDIVYKGSPESVRRASMGDGKVPLVSGPVFFGRAVAEKLLQMHVTPPLDGCTYLGLDSGAPPLQLSLFLDLLKCLCRDVSEEQFVDGAPAASRRGRKELWRILRGTPFNLAYVPGGGYDYMTLSGREYILRLTREPGGTHALSHIQVEVDVSPGSRVINSVLEGSVTVAGGAVVQHCRLQGPLRVPPGCLLSGLDGWPDDTDGPALRPDTVVQGHRVRRGRRKLSVYSVLGALDDLELCCDDEGASFLNAPWGVFFAGTGVRPEDLWASGESRSLLGARLFPAPRRGEGGVWGVAWLLAGGGDGEGARRWRRARRLSFREILSLTHQEAELRRREDLLFLAGRKRAGDALVRPSDVCLLPIFRAAVAGGQQGALLRLLDELAATGGGAEREEDNKAEEEESRGEPRDLGVSARCLACVADVLACWAEAEGGGGLRSGPAANRHWSAAYSLLEEGHPKAGVRALAAERARWLGRPDLLVRASRHYEGAAQTLLRRAVMRSREFAGVGRGEELPPLGCWHQVDCPARIDLAGGWSDTPPMAFERGGCVTNVAVKVDGRRPIGARARRVPRPRLLLLTRAGGRDSDVVTETCCERVEDLADYCQPNAPGALLKAACVCAGVASPSSSEPLESQLASRWGGGLEIHAWSALPAGSGLGTSSILAGALLAAIYQATGRSYSRDALIHAVLHLEQVLTTGGGWQDQVGGLEGGIKVGRSEARLPLRVRVERPAVPDGFLRALERHLLLVYTGKTRLARNLLQAVVRRWYSRLPAMVRDVGELVANGEDCARACRDGCLSAVGICLDRSWLHKKCMAPGCEPTTVRAIMEALRPLALGQSLAGAGGGGFLCLLSRLPDQKDAVACVLADAPGVGDFTVHTVEIDTEGLALLQPV
ncbi:L-fucose kinase isoform X2 [Stigmatopora argus]